MPRNVFRFINDLDDQTVSRLADRLEFRATDAGFVSMREAALASLPLATAGRVLALGCGTGVEVRALKRHPEFRGKVVGVDHSPLLIAEARRLTVEEGLDAGVAYRVGDAQALDLPDGTFDLVLAHTLISHVADPLAAITEARRVVAPGGLVEIFDGDYASMTFAHPDHALAERIERAMLEVLVNNPRVMRDLPGLLREAGLDLEAGTAHAYADIGAGRFFANVVESFGGPLLVDAGLLPADDVARWLSWQMAALANRTFFGTANFYTYLARRPADSTDA